jgi:hypothetical protein
MTLGDDTNLLIGYNRHMFRCTRIGFIAVLALAVGTLPLMLDQCAATCETHHETVASTPACHHSGATGAHLGQTPGSCGHGHNSASITPDNGSIPNLRDFSTGVAVFVTPTSLTVAATPQTVRTYAPPGLDDQQFERRALPLRI